jgi:predicted ATP-grasp superfamily ATP-dependent carboligase
MSTAERPRVVVLGMLWAGLALARALGRSGVPVSAASFHDDDFGMTSRYLRRRLVASRPGPDRDRAVLDLVRQEAADGPVVLVPERDDHVEWALRHAGELRDLAAVPLPPDPDVTMRLRRKERLAGEAERAGVAVPRTLFAASEADVREAPLRPPFLVKPAEGQDFALAFGRKVVLARTRDEAVEAWREARARGFDTIVQELVPDSHERIFSLFTYIGRDGAARADVVGRKVRQGPRRFGTAAVFRVEPEPRVREAGHRLLSTVGYRGFAQVEFAHDARDDEWKVLEVNTRMPQWAGLAMTPRFDIARIAYDDLRGAPAGAPRELTDELSWIFFAKDAWVSVQMARRGELSAREFLAEYVRRGKVRAVFAPDDLRPALSSLSYLRSKVG